MTTDEILLDVEERMEKAIRKLKGDLAGIRTGRANPGLVDSLRVEVYGSAVPIKQVASVGAAEPNQIVIRPYDPGTIKDIEKAIQTSDLGFNPQSDGRLIRLNVPPLSTEVRRKMVGRVKELAEEAKVADPQHPPRRQQAGRHRREGQGLLRGRPRPGQGRNPGTHQDLRSPGHRLGQGPRKRGHGGVIIPVFADAESIANANLVIAGIGLTATIGLIILTAIYVIANSQTCSLSDGSVRSRLFSTC